MTTLNEPKTTPPDRPLRVLLVEDDPARIERIATVLGRAGYSLCLSVANSPSSIPEQVERDPYDVVLTNHTLGQGTGFDVLEKLAGAGQKTPVIVVSPKLGEEVAVEYLKRGAADCVLDHRLERLPAALSQALCDKAQRERAARHQEEILTAKREWELTVDAVPDPLFLIDQDCRVLRANRAATKVLGLKFAELVGRPCWEVIHGWAEPAPSCPHQQLLETGAEASCDLEEPRLVKIFHCTATPLRDSRLSLRGCVFLMHDMTGRRRAEAALRESEERFRQMAEAIDEVFYISGPRGTPVYYVSPAFEKVFGRSLKTIYENPRLALEAIHPDDREGIIAALKKLAETGEALETDCRIVRPDGFIRHIWSHTIPVRGGAGVVGRVVGVCRDITDRRQLQLQLFQAQKMEAVGRLAGGVAHDFNNLLTIISGYTQLLLDRPESGEPQRGYLEEVDQAAKRAAQLTRHLLAFSRRQVLMPEVFDLNVIVTGMEKMLTRLIGEDIHLATSCQPGLGLVKADPGQIEQVIMNLVVNARDAMPHGGKLTLHTTNVDLDANDASRQEDVTPGPYVMLAVTDTGFGMTGETLKHIFEPFFTTKEKGQGSGLGLAMVYGIVKQSEGHIEVHSEVGRGTTFKIHLPRVLQAVEAVAPAKPRVGPATGSETVLVVEDEDALRALVCKMLREKGYTVLEASRGGDALEISSRREGPIHLMLTDVVMPGMNGRELAVRLAAVHPETLVLFMSGYTDDAVIDRGVAVSGQCFLQKPFKPEALARKVREVLDAGAPPQVTQADDSSPR